MFDTVPDCWTNDNGILFPSGTVLFKFIEFTVTNSCRNFYFKDSDVTFDIFKLFLLTNIFFAASFLNLMLIIGTLRSFGIIYGELLETYNVGAGYTAIILSIVIFLVAVGGMSHIKTRYILKQYIVLSSSEGSSTSTWEQIVSLSLLIYSFIPVIPMRQRLFQRQNTTEHLSSHCGILMMICPLMYKLRYPDTIKKSVNI
jgi:hypothetical protein